MIRQKSLNEGNLTVINGSGGLVIIPKDDVVIVWSRILELMVLFGYSKAGLFQRDFSRGRAVGTRAILHKAKKEFGDVELGKFIEPNRIHRIEFGERGWYERGTIAPAEFWIA